MYNIINSIIILLFLVGCGSSPNDIILGSWVESIPGGGRDADEVQGFTLRKDGKASSINMHTLLYEDWELLDKKTIILKGKSMGNKQTVEFSDTLKIEKLDSDSFILKRNNLYMRYGR